MRRRRRRWGASWAAALLCLLSPAPADDNAYAVLLAQSVKDDGIDYKALAAGRAALDAYVIRLANADPGATDPDRMAFWINAFNALALRQAIDAPAPACTWKVAGREVTLDGIVEILKGHGEPLVQFALHRPERSSPPLSAALYEGKSLDAALLQQARAYLGDEAQNVFDYAQLRATLSMLFLRHREEFESGRKGDVPPLQLFLADHLPAEPKKFEAVGRSLRKTAWRISFRPYDASLDEAGARRRALHPAWIALYAVAVAVLLAVGFRGFKAMFAR